MNGLSRQAQMSACPRGEAGNKVKCPRVRGGVSRPQRGTWEAKCPRVRLVTCCDRTAEGASAGAHGRDVGERKGGGRKGVEREAELGDRALDGEPKRATLEQPPEPDPGTAARCLMTRCVIRHLLKFDRVGLTPRGDSLC